MARHGVELERRFEVPAYFPISQSVKIPGPMYEELKAEVAKREEKGGAGLENVN